MIYGIQDVCNACIAERPDPHIEDTTPFRKNTCGGYGNIPAMSMGKRVDFAMWKEFDNQKQILNFLFEKVANGDGVAAYVSGNVGIGKTFISKIIHNQVLADDKSSCFVTDSDLVSVCRAACVKGSNSDLEGTIREFQKVHCLIIDDFGTTKSTDFVREKYFQILNYRYEHRFEGMVTIINSNLQLEAIEDRDSRLSSRFADQTWMKYFVIDGDDLRLKQQEIW